MKISNQGVTKAFKTPAAGESTETTTAAPKPASGLLGNEVELQFSKLQPVLEKLKDMPDMDHAKVAQLREAIENGEMPFNATRLAALIHKYHGAK